MARSSSIHRALDFLAGVPVIFALSLLRTRRSLPLSPRRIGIICPTAIGDLILATGLLVRIQERFPDAEIHVIHGKNNAGVVPMLPVRVIGQVFDFRNIPRVARCLKAMDLDIVVDVTPWPRTTAIAAWFSGAVSIGYRTRWQFRHFAFDFVVPHLQDRHEIENLNAIADLFLKMSRYELALVAPKSSLDQTLDWHTMVVFHTCPGGSRSVEKRWPNQDWAELADRLVDRGYCVCFTGVASDRNVVEDIVQKTTCDKEKLRSLCGNMSLKDMYWALRCCRVFVTVDTGVMHMASVMEVPAVALIGPTDVRRWGPRSRNFIVIQSKHPRAGYISLGFERSRGAEEIMRRIGVEEVFNAVVSKL